jgi:hypothetical protein
LNPSRASVFPEDQFLEEQMKRSMADDTLAWLGVQTHSKRVQRCLKKVLDEMIAEAQLILRDRRLQIEVIPRSSGPGEVWAYFPMHRRRLIAKDMSLKPTTRVLLLICKPGVESRPLKKTEEELRHHLGHVLRYLHRPKWRNECKDADKAWSQCSLNRKTMRRKTQSQRKSPPDHNDD